MKTNMTPNGRKLELLDIDGQISGLLGDLKTTLRLLGREVHEHPRGGLPADTDEALDTCEFLTAKASEALEELTVQITTRSKIAGGAA